jgi:hypothetical protein
LKSIGSGRFSTFSDSELLQKIFFIFLAVNATLTLLHWVIGVCLVKILLFLILSRPLLSIDWRN